MKIERERCANLEASRRLEWLLANGRGGFAMGTVAGVLSRRYHGLLVAAPKTPVHRFVLLAKVEAAVLVDGQRVELSTNDYENATHPRGHQWLESFCDHPQPTWIWRVGAAVIECTLRMLPGEDAIVVKYRLIEGPAGVALELRPFCTGRAYHHLTRREQQGEPQLHAGAHGFALRWPGDAPALFVNGSGDFHAQPDWYNHFQLSEEAARGYDHSQDLFCPGWFSSPLRPGDPAGAVLLASTQQHDATVDWAAAMPRIAPLSAEPPISAVAQMRQAMAAGRIETDLLLDPLARASRLFVTTVGEGRRTIIAGYPWFGDWGRDTFISLPGLCLVTGRFDDARDILKTFANSLNAGLLPNRFADASDAQTDTPDYNSVDAPLWYVHALGRYFAYTNDLVTVRDLYPVLADILTQFEKGTRFAIRVDADGLLAAGEPGVQLTWMDAKIGDWVVTPRIGKPVEINALWYNALQIGADCARRLGKAGDVTRWSQAAARCQRAFAARFWNESRGCLYDVVDVDHRAGAVDGSIRPNQLFAISLPHAVAPEARWKSVVAVVGKSLVTPLGLRTLAPDDAAFCPRYAGDQRSRDSAYHQGTAWPYLLGPFVSAFVRAGGATPDVRARSRIFLKGVESHLGCAGIGGVSEVADGQSPYAPGGCPWQAWSVAEPLRALVEDCFAARVSAPA